MGVWCKSIDGHTQLATTTPHNGTNSSFALRLFPPSASTVCGVIFLGVGGSTKGVVLIF